MISPERFGILTAILTLTGCSDAAPPGKSDTNAPPSVLTLPVESKEVSTVIEYVGRSKASQRVEIRARIKGVLIKRPFEEGSELEAGAIMFNIDPAEFAAKRDSAKANVDKAEAAVEEASNSLARYEKLLKTDAASVAKYDEAKAKDATARAELAAARAALKTAELDLGYTDIKTPISGRSGRAHADIGNLISPETGVLATVVKLDPIYVTFSIGEREYLTFMQARTSGDAPSMTPRIKLANDTLYAHAGTFKLIDNEVDPATGTIAIRVSFPNPDRLLVPGQFVNVVLTSDKPDTHVVLPQAAVQENQTGPFVLVVDAENRVAARPIKTGQRVGTEIVALEGLEPGETIIIEGIQKVRPGANVNPTMATSRPPAKSDSK